MGTELTLTVQSAKDEDVYKDIVRIPQADRGELKTGRVHRFSVKGEGSGYFILRGAAERYNGTIRMDSAARSRLNLGSGKTYVFKVEEAGFIGELVWGWYATDPSYRAAARLGVLSFFLAIIALAPVVFTICARYIWPSFLDLVAWLIFGAG